jgi:hypothetical protein
MWPALSVFCLSRVLIATNCQRLCALFQLSSPIGVVAFSDLKLFVHGNSCPPVVSCVDEAPLPVRCSCGDLTWVETTGSTAYPDSKCPKCGITRYIVGSSRISEKLHHRAIYEIRRQDWTMAIILSAMAVEAEIAYLHAKWSFRVSCAGDKEQENRAEHQWEAKFRKLIPIVKRLDSLTVLLADRDFNDFVSRNQQDLGGHFSGLGHEPAKYLRAGTFLAAQQNRPFGQCWLYQARSSELCDYRSADVDNL